MVTRTRVWNPEGVRRGTRRYRRYLQKSCRANLGCRCCDTAHERRMQARYKRDRFLRRVCTTEE